MGEFEASLFNPTYSCGFVHQVAKYGCSHFLRITGGSTYFQRAVARPTHAIEEHVEVSDMVQVQVSQEQLVQFGWRYFQAPKILNRTPAHIEDELVTIAQFTQPACSGLGAAYNGIT